MKYLSLISDDIQYLKFTDALTGEELAHVDKDEIRVKNGYEVRYRPTVKSGGHSLINLTFESAICNRSAEDMFKELGYKKIENKLQIVFLRYGEREESIYFDKDQKTFSKIEDCIDTDIYMDELKAIVQQCRELGWIE